MEIWRDIAGFEGFYMVSSIGRVKRGQVYRGIYRNGQVKERIIKPFSCKGYLRVTMIKNGKRANFFVHRLVAFAFIPNHENKPVINHKNFIRNDNRVENLEWCTLIENVQHSAKAGRIGKHAKRKKKLWYRGSMILAVEKLVAI